MKRKTKKKATSTSAGTKRVTLISRRAKAIRKKGEAWISAIKRASNLLKKEGKL